MNLYLIFFQNSKSKLLCITIAQIEINFVIDKIRNENTFKFVKLMILDCKTLYLIKKNKKFQK